MHHAGGSHREYRSWVQHFPARWEVWVASRRTGAPADGSETVTRFCHRLADALAPLVDRPLALFGHSMGALVCYELAHVMRRQGLPDPVWLGVSAHSGPQQLPSGPARRPPTSEDLRAMAAELGGLQPSILGNDALWALIEPALRSDVNMIATWKPEARPRLSTPITAFCGESDALAGPRAVRAWEACTEGFLGVRTHIGGHFYFRNAVESLIDQMVNDIRLCLPRLPARRLSRARSTTARAGSTGDRAVGRAPVSIMPEPHSG
jgi:surfactin synthase thioesterase subunit